MNADIVPLWPDSAAKDAEARPAQLLPHSPDPSDDSGDEADEWPWWVRRLALADFCSIDVLQTVADTAHVEVSRGFARALLAGMQRGGYFLQPPVGSVFQLRAEVSSRWLAELEQAGELAQARDQLAAAGLAPRPGSVGARLAAAALESGDWAGLEAVWRLYPSGELVADAAVRAGYARASGDLRARYPGLSIAAAIASSFEAESGRLDLDRMVTALVRDGSTLHGRWQEHQSPEAKVVAGTLSLLAHALMPGAKGTTPSEAEAQTYATLVELIRDSSLTRGDLTARALTLFHSTVALLRLLRGDWAGARKEAEYALILNDGCGLPGFVAAVVSRISCALIGDAQGPAAAEQFLASHAAHQCRPGAWIEPALHLVHADTALRALDRDGATRHLQRHVEEAGQTHWLAAPALHAAILSIAAILWDDPEHALARFDSLVPDLAGRSLHPDAWTRLLLTCRAQLLLALGAVSQAERLVLRAVPGEDPAVSLVGTAWVSLCAGRFSEALMTADEGIFESRISVSERAFLYAVKSAALLQAGAAEELVSSAARAACLVCAQAGTLLPFALLPGSIRNRLVVQHARQHDEPDCPVGQALRRGVFDQLTDAAVVVARPMRLTRREEVLLPLLATAASIPEIASEQYVSVNTLRKQVVTLRQKFGATSRDDLVRKAHEAGLLNRTPKPGSRPNTT